MYFDAAQKAFLQLERPLGFRKSDMSNRDETRGEMGANPLQDLRNIFFFISFIRRNIWENSESKIVCHFRDVYNNGRGNEKAFLFSRATQNRSSREHLFNGHHAFNIILNGN